MRLDLIIRMYSPRALFALLTRDYTKALDKS